MTAGTALEYGDKMLAWLNKTKKKEKPHLKLFLSAVPSIVVHLAICSFFVCLVKM